MTNKEAIDILEKSIKCEEGVDCCKVCPDCCICSTPEAKIEAFNMAIAALEKQEPVRPTDIRNYGDKDKVGFCPVCRVGANSYMKYCEECGQRLNWTEDAE